MLQAIVPSSAGVAVEVTACVTAPAGKVVVGACIQLVGAPPVQDSKPSKSVGAPNGAGAYAGVCACVLMVNTINAATVRLSSFDFIFCFFICFRLLVFIYGLVISKI